MATIDELAYYCREENSFGALMLTGKWGCGKTYLIENDLSDELGNDYIIIRVSLFGESSVDNIHQKVQKAYFQEVMLNLGGNIVKLLPNIPEDKAAKMGEKVDKTMGTMAEKMEKSKIGRVLKFASEIAQNVSGLDKILSLNPSEYIPVEETIAGKRVILVFDDLERCDPDVGEVAILGCINEYCENKHIKTIIIANEEKIIERNQAVKKTDDENADDIEPRSRKIKYAEIKEKIVARTVKNIPNYSSILKGIIAAYQTKDENYKKFLEEHVTDLVNVFCSGGIENIRSIKSAIQDFQRIFTKLKIQEVDEDMLLFFQTFVAFTLLFKEGKINKSENYGYLFCDSDVEKTFPGYYVRRYMLPSVKDWLTVGKWNEDEVQEDIDKIVMLEKEADPKELVRNMRLIDLEEETIIKGFPEVLKMAYAGELAIDGYITLISNLLWARTISYELPEKPDMNRLGEGVDACLENLCNSDDPDTRNRTMIPQNNIDSLTEDEKKIYAKICEFRDKNLQMFAINERRYLNALRSGNLSEVYECENKRFNIFDKELAEAVVDCYKELQNVDRVPFIGVFKKIWAVRVGNQDLLIEESAVGMEDLIANLKANKMEEQKAGYGLKAALTENFIQDASSILKKMEMEAERVKKVQ